MPLIAITLGAILTILGLAGYILSGMASWTALIPAFFGLPILIIGFVARKEARRKHAMHAASALALLGLLGSARGIPSVVTMIQGGDVERPQAAIVQALMALLCAAFVALAVKSFIDARRAAQTPTAETQS